MGPFGALYLTQLRIQATRARILSLGALGYAGVFVAYFVGRYSSTVQDASDFVSLFGLAVLIPITSLVFASAGFGDPVDDGTLVYLWMRPVGRTRLLLASMLATLTITIPLTVLPTMLIPVTMRAPSRLVAPAFVASLVALLTYVALFTALGLRTKRALVWGLLYIFIWEGFVAQAGGNPAKLAIRAYAQSLVSSSTGVSFELTTIDNPWAWAVPLAVVLLTGLYTVRRLRRTDVP